MTLAAASSQNLAGRGGDPRRLGEADRAGPGDERGVLRAGRWDERACPQIDVREPVEDDPAPVEPMKDDAPMETPPLRAVIAISCVPMFVTWAAVPVATPVAASIAVRPVPALTIVPFPSETEPPRAVTRTSWEPVLATCAPRGQPDARPGIDHDPPRARPGSKPPIRPRRWRSSRGR